MASGPEFRAFDAQHLAALAVIAACCLLEAWGGGRLPASGRKMLGGFLGLLLAGYTAAFYILQETQNALSWEYSLPLDLCSLVLITAILSMFRPGGWLHEITYFFGLGGSLQALATPDLGSGFPSWDFLLFFWSHGGILLGVVYILAAKGFRPRSGSVLRMMGVLNLYAAVVGALNFFTGWNYGYLCRKPAGPSLFDLLGPWPWYLLSLEGVALGTFFILALPWKYRPAP